MTKQPTLTKADLIEEVLKVAELPRKESETIVETIFESIIEALQKGDEVVTAGGLLGRIAKLTDQYATIEVAPNTEIIVQRQAVAQLLPKGTIKNL